MRASLASEGSERYMGSSSDIAGDVAFFNFKKAFDNIKWNEQFKVL